MNFGVSYMKSGRNTSKNYLTFMKEKILDLIKYLSRTDYLEYHNGLESDFIETYTKIGGYYYFFHWLRKGGVQPISFFIENYVKGYSEQRNDISNVFINAFSWYRSPQERPYWENLSKEWIKHLETNEKIIHEMYEG